MTPLRPPKPSGDSKALRRVLPLLAAVSTLATVRYLGDWEAAVVAAAWIGITGYLWARQVAELESTRDNFYRLAYADDLTGLPNGRNFRERLSIELSRAMGNRSCLALISIDVDQFKLFNDTFGHEAGDAALKTVGVILLENSGEKERVYRLGGDEFAVLLPNHERPAALKLAEQMRAALEARTWPLRPITASFGVATLDGPDPEAILGRADGALYEAKRAGSNRVAVS